MAHLDYGTAVFVRKINELITLCRDDYLIIEDDVKFISFIIDFISKDYHKLGILEIFYNKFRMVLRGDEIGTLKTYVEKYLRIYEWETEKRSKPSISKPTVLEPTTTELINQKLSDDVERVFKEQDHAKQIAADEVLAHVVQEEETGKQEKVPTSDVEKKHDGTNAPDGFDEQELLTAIELSKQSIRKSDDCEDQEHLVMKISELEQQITEVRIKMEQAPDDIAYLFSEWEKRDNELKTLRSRLTTSDDIIVRTMRELKGDIDRANSSGDGNKMYAQIMRTNMNLTKNVGHSNPNINAIVREIFNKYRNLSSDKICKLHERLNKDSHECYCDIYQYRNFVSTHYSQYTASIVVTRIAIIRVVRYNESAAEISGYIQKTIA